MFDALNWTNVVVAAILGGEPRSCITLIGTDNSHKSSRSLGYGPCISNPEKC